jgi:hypothetical protein
MKIKKAKQLTMAGLLILMSGSNSDACCMCKSTPFSPPSGPATGSFNGLHRESNFLAISLPVIPFSL